MSKFRRHSSRQSIQRQQHAAACAIEALEERQMLSLVIDVRMADGTKAANITSVGQVLNLQVWAIVSGTDNPGTLDGFQEVIGSIVSTHTASGSVHGNLADTLLSPFTDTAAQSGELQDLNGDGDIDIGSNDTSTSDNYFFSRSGGMDFNGTVVNNTNSFELATLTYTVTSLSFGQATDVNFVIPPFSLDAIWRQDNLPFNNQNGSLTAGTPVVLTSNAAPPLPTGAISGTVFNDANGNGTQDSGEQGISGVTVYLDTNDNGTHDAGEPSTTTNASGAYNFSGLAAGIYTVRQIVPSGDTQTLPAQGAADSVNLATNSSTGTANFGDEPPAVVKPPSTGSISGTVFNDVNGNGKLDSGELGIANVTVYDDASNAGVFKSGDVEAVTNASGVYSLSNLPGGAYIIRQILPSGDTQTLPAGGVGIHITLAAAQTVTGQNFGDEGSVVVTPPTTGSITGTVFNDANGNGKLDAGELGISGVSVYIDTNNKGVFASGDPEVTTNASGIYSFGGLSAGAYIVRQILPSGDKQTLPSGGLGSHITLAAGQAVLNTNFGDEGTTVVPPPTGGSISGIVFNDTNGDGVQNSGELGISGVSVYIDTTNAGVFKTGDLETTTNASGDYSFTGLSAGAYIVRQILSGSVTQDFPTNGFGNHVTLAANQAATGINFGDHASTVSMAGTVFADTNGNGKQDSGELGIAGVTVQLEVNNSGTIELLATGTTNASGGYTFIGLPPDTYLIHQVVPSGDTQDFPAANADNSVTLTSGQAATGLNFGDATMTVTPPPTGGSITGTVFTDTNGNGVQDSGELGIANVTVYDDATNAGVFKAGDLETVTNASGVYTFSNLPAGAYVIRQILPSGDTQDFPTGGFGQHVTLAANQAATNANFGDKTSTVVTPPASGSITGTVFNDANGNGVQDSGELGISGVSVYMDLTNAGTFKSGDPIVTTNASGVYSFPVVGAGTYIIRQILPSGDEQTAPANGFGNHVTLATSSSTATGANFGDQSPTVVTSPLLGTISGTVFNDTNGNGKLDSGELGIANVTVYIDMGNTGSFKVGDIETTTDASGDYSFSGLPAGTYVIRQILPSGDKQTAPSGGNSITLAAGQVVTTANFGDELVASPAEIIDVDSSIDSGLSFPTV